MKELKLKYQVGVTLIISHLIILLSLILLRLINGFSKQEFTTTIGIITPMFSGYTLAVIIFIIKDRHKSYRNEKYVTKSFAFLLFLFPITFSLLILISIWLKAYNIAFYDFEDFKTTVITLESIFAIYSSLFIYTLFPKHDDKLD